MKTKTKTGLAILLGLIVLFMPTYALATEYHQPSENGTIYAHVLHLNGTPANGATVNLTLWRPNGTKALDDVSMGFLTGSNGIYLYNFTAPSIVGIYAVDIISSNPTGYGADEIHVSNITYNVTYGNITLNCTTAEELWNTTMVGYTNTSTFGGSINDLLGGGNMLSVILIILGFGLMVFGWWRKSQPMLWVAALTWIGFLFWHRSLSADWGAFDVHEILFFVGLMMVVICIVEATMIYREEQPEPKERVPEETPASRHKKLMDSLNARREQFGRRRR